MRYFLTGGTGFVGSYLARLLRKEGHAVVAVVRTPAKAGALVDLGVEVVKGDVTDKESMRAPMTGCDGVFHVAGWYKLGSKHPEDGEKINVGGTMNVLELMRELGIQKGVYTSTLAINSDTHGATYDESFHYSGKHLSVYDKTKAEAHRLALEFMKNGLPLVIVMPGLIYGPDGTGLSDEALRNYLRKKLPMISKGSGYCWAHVEDIAMGHYLAMQKAQPGTVYIIAGPKHTMQDAFTIAQKITGIKAPMAAPAGMIKFSARISAAVEWLIPLPELYRSETLRVSAGATYYGDNGKAKKELDYAPRDLETGLRETLQYEWDKIKQKK
ncbi:MAG: NAD-dependent epimerase/dehydratase family protein [Chitinophagales bacterium]